MASVFFLGALLAAAAWLVTCRLALVGRALRLVCFSVCASSLQMLPFYVLGFCNRLTRGSVALATLAECALVAALCLRTSPRSELARAMQAARELTRLPADALAGLVRERSPLLVPLLACALLVPWLLLTAYLAPQFRGWDALWYHETMTGFTLQNAGFSPLDLPIDQQKVNGYPRLGEMTQAWFALFAGRRLLDVPNALFMPCLFAASFELVGVATRERSVRLGWAACVVLMPACLHLLQSVYVDPQAAALIVAASALVLRPQAGARELALGALAGALALCCKYVALPPVMALVLIGFLRFCALFGQPALRRASLAAFALSVLVIALALSTTYLKNYLFFRNPVWPDVHVQNAALHIDWPGQQPWRTAGAGDGGQLDMNLPLRELLPMLFARPFSVTRWHYGEMTLYGFTFIWVALPLAALGLGWSWLAALRALVRRAPLGAEPARARAFLFATFALAVVLWTSPALWCARYNIAGAALVATCAAWFAERLRAPALAQAAPFTVALGGLLVVYWMEPAFIRSPKQLLELWRVPSMLREVDQKLGASTPTQIGVARERELGPGSVVALNDFKFPSLLWNNDYSNRVVFVRGESLEHAALRLDARWVLCRALECEPFRRRGYRALGRIDLDGDGDVYAQPTP